MRKSSTIGEQVEFLLEKAVERERLAFDAAFVGDRAAAHAFKIQAQSYLEEAVDLEQGQ